MVDVMQGIEDDVPFDDATCDALIAFCTASAASIEGQAGARASAVRTGSTDFEGLFSRLFIDNASVARSDASELATRLRELAVFAGELKAKAQAEQVRRQTARDWKTSLDQRNWFERTWDNWTNSEKDARPPVGPPDPQQSKASPPFPQGSRQTPHSGSGEVGGGTSSARPENLRSFASLNRALNEELSRLPDVLAGKLADFAARCLWGKLNGSSVVSGFRKWNTANEEDVGWATVIAGAFERAGSVSGIHRLSDSALFAVLQSRGVDVTRDDIQIDPAIAIGHPPTTGYAVDPVNTATGNFLETEIDLGFNDSAKGLTWARTYNSFDVGTGAFGPGWSSWAEAGLAFDDESARMRLDDGRVIVFPRTGEGWGRGIGENIWLERTVEGDYRARDNAGKTWEYTSTGQLRRTATGPGSETTFYHSDDGRLTRLAHARGRAIDLEWNAERVVALIASDGRRATFEYDQQGRLVAAAADQGRRSYAWTVEGTLERVVDADGVVEVKNEYDTQRRVARQWTRHGRVVRFTYLDGRVTVVSDEDGTRSNTWFHDGRGRLIGVVDADGQRQSMSYDRHGNLVMVTERNGDLTVHEYDDRGRRIRTVTPSGADLTFGFDDLDRATTIVTEAGAVTEYRYDDDHRNPAVMTDPEGGQTRFTWDDGLLTEVVDPVGVRVRFEFDGHGDLVSTIDALGNTARLERDAVGRVTAAITPSGNRTTYAFDANGQLTRRRDPDGAVWRYERTRAGRLAAVVDPLGARTEIDYGPHGDEVWTIDPLGRSISRELDDLGNLAVSQLPDGSTWQFTHDALSRLVATVDPTGATWRHEYGDNGQLTVTIDPTGVRRTVSADSAAGTVQVSDGEATIGARMDPLGRVLSSERADGSLVMASYDRCGRPVELLDADGGLTKLTRDAAGRVVAQTSPMGSVARFEYDSCGRLAATIDPLGARATVEYDADGRVVRQVLPTGDTAWAEYDPCGRVIAHHRPGRGTARYVYDAAGRVVRSADPWLGQRKLAYDTAGQLVAVVNGLGGVTRYEYDANGRAVAITDPLGLVTRREFDGMNRCVAVTDPLGRVTRAGYDGAGRQIWQQDPDGRRTEWTFDAAGRSKAIRVDGRAIASIERDLRARTVRIVDHSGPDGGPAMVHELEWNRHGQLVRRARDGVGVTWTYDADGRRTAMTTPDGRTTSYRWDANGLLAGVDHPTFGRASFGRDAAGRLVDASAGGIIQGWEYVDGHVVGHTVTGADGSRRTRLDRDDQGRIVAIDRDGTLTRYAYDDACQLIEATLGADVHRWTYDSAGRLVAETADGVRLEHTYDAASQLVASRGSDGSSVTHSYDPVGRRVRSEHSDGRHRVFEWSETGWLAAVTDHGAGGTRRTTTHVDATGELAAVNDVHVWWDSASYAGAPVLVGGEAVVATGAVTGVGDAWASPGWRQSRSGCDPWGFRAASQLPGGVVVGAAGELSIGGADPLEWLGARVYDPTTRAFLSVDPLDSVPGAGWSGNPYAYAGNDPLHALDPLGLRPATDADLQAYAREHAGALGGVKDWVKNNWEYIVGGALVIAGGALMYTGIGGPAGLALLVAGADTIGQRFLTGKVDWVQVGASGVIGGVTAGAGSWALRVGKGGPAALRTVMSVNAGMGGAASEAAYLYKNRGHLTLRGMVASLGGGVFSGIVGGAAGPAGGTLARKFGQSATGLTSQGITAGIDFFGGLGADLTTSIMNAEPIDLAKATQSGVVNSAGGGLASKLARPGTGMTTLSQISHFGPRTISGVTDLTATNTMAIVSEAGLGNLFGMTFDLASP